MRIKVKTATSMHAPNKRRGAIHCNNLCREFVSYIRSMHLMLLSGGLLTLLVASIAAPVQASAYQSLQHIRSVAADFALQRARASGLNPRIASLRIDPRLRLHQCSRALESFVPNGARIVGRITVGVRCRGTRRWSIYVPMLVEAKSTVLISTRMLPRGHIIRETDIRAVGRDIGMLAHANLTQPGDAIGKVVKTGIPTGAVIDPHMLRAAFTVRRGQRVDIIATTGALVVRMQGTALANGAPGALISVRNMHTGKLIQGVVTADGRVRVNL